MPFAEIIRTEAFRALLDLALTEDVGSGDVTTRALVDPGAHASARIAARMPLVMAGGEVAAAVFVAVDAGIRVDVRVRDGATVAAGHSVIGLEGPAAGILTAERTALNFLQRLCGIASLTRRYVEAAGGRVAVLDTRKTLPGWRALEKAAVAAGGGTNHRAGLHDAVLIKDNHLRFWTAGKGGRLANAVRAARARWPDLKIEIEVDTPGQLDEVLEANPDWVLLDNMTPDQLADCVRRAAGRCRLEASGGVTLATVPAIAATGVDAVSVGALTHSAAAVDLGLDFD